MSPEIVADAARSPTLADGMSRGQARTAGTRHQAARTAGLLQDRNRIRGATAAQPYATVSARSSEPARVIGHDLVSDASRGAATATPRTRKDHGRQPGDRGASHRGPLSPR